MTPVTTAAAPAALERYLRRATAGLPPAKRQEVWDELEEHVYARAEQLEWQGARPEQALSRALAELGPSLQVSAGMNGVHNMPKMIALGGGVALTLSAAFYALAGGGNIAQITLPILTQVPAKTQCVRGTKPSGPDLETVSEKDGVTCFRSKSPMQGAFLSYAAVQQAVRAQGGTVTTLNGGSMKASFPNGTWFTVNSYFTVNGERYYFAGSLASSLMTSASPSSIVLSGYSRPILQVDETRFQFGSDDQEIGRSFYGAFGLEFMSLLLPPTSGEQSIGMSTGSRAVRHAVQTGQRPGEVVMLVTQRAGSNFSISFAPVQSDGNVRLDAEYPRLRFVTDPAQLGPDPSEGRINALLVRVTNIPLSNLKSGIFVPAQSTSDAP